MGLAVAFLSRLSRSSRFRVITVLAVAAPLLCLAAPAGAAPGAESATAAPRPATAGPHCVLAAGNDQPLRCYATFPAAVAVATGGRVTTAPSSPAAAAADPRFTAAVEAAATQVSARGAVTAGGSVLVGIEYADLNYGGGSLSMTASGGCDYSLDVDYRFPSMPSGWNDRISSFRSYSNCAQQLFAAINFQGGALTGITSSMSYVGPSANDRASSVTFN